MVITYYGVSCFKEQAGETVLAFDPPSKESEYKSPRFQTDIVFVSHNHKDHNGYENMAGKTEGKSPLLIEGPGEYDAKGIYAIGIRDQENTIYKVVFEDIEICHLGGFKEKNLRPEIKEAIGNVDILFAPINGEHLSASDAAKIISHIGPKIAVPMHYDKQARLKKFLDEFGNGDAKSIDKLTIKKKDLPTGKTQIVVLQPII